MQGVVCSGLAYYIQGVIMKDRGPVFVTAFSPLCMVIVAIMGSFILAEQLVLGRYISNLYHAHFISILLTSNLVKRYLDNDLSSYVTG